MKIIDVRKLLREENGLEIIKDLEEEQGNKLIKRKIKNFYNLTPRAYYKNYEVPRYSVIYELPRYDQNVSTYSVEAWSNYNVYGKTGYR